MPNLTNSAELVAGNSTLSNYDGVVRDAALSNNQDKHNAISHHSVVKRNGNTTAYERIKIVHAITKALIAVEGQDAEKSARIHEQAERISQEVEDALLRHLPEDGVMYIENIQDLVELSLMRSGEHKVARAYVLYREEQSSKRLADTAGLPKPKRHIVRSDGSQYEFDPAKLHDELSMAISGIEDVDINQLYSPCLESLFDGMSQDNYHQSLILNTRARIDQDPGYGRVAARLLLNKLRNEAASFVFQEQCDIPQSDAEEFYPAYFKAYIRRSSKLGLLDEELGKFDLDILADALLPDQDLNFDYLGLQTLYDRYFIHSGDTKLELPQAFFMRVSMGLAINENDREQKAIEFYDLLSSFDFMSSTPTLFNSGTPRPQLSSCYLTSVPDSLKGIYSSFSDNALLSKFAGGLGNDWTRVRGLGSKIKGTNGHSQGVVPFLKVANDTAVAVNQGGKRKGAVCAYLETWHIDVEDFLELRKNTGDERRRTHDMNTANWVPDLFMQRVIEDKGWTLFSPDEVPNLHELYGEEFNTAYVAYEEQAKQGRISLFREVKAVDLWRKMLGMLFETGHPWLTFKDPCNIRYSNQHAGVVHSSNLCTEITLHTNDDEIAVCNLGSVNLANHVDEDGLNTDKLQATIRTAMRMLDNVIDYNYYSVASAKHSNSQHRPVGLGLMGFQDALYRQNMAYNSQAAVEFADESMEWISYLAIDASSELAKERGEYASYSGSLWSQGVLPIDSIATLAQSRGQYLDQDTSESLDWESLRSKIREFGMRNSNCLAIAPTATISNICSVSQSIEPTYQNLYVKSNLSGEFTVVNAHLVRQLKTHGLWDEVMSNDLKYYDGSVQSIERIPESIKTIFHNAFEIDSRWLIEAASRRQKWIDQAQSLNLYMAEPSGKKLDELYKYAWIKGLKTTYYLRSLGATQAEKSVVAKTNIQETSKAPTVCSILEPDCDACQ